MTADVIVPPSNGTGVIAVDSGRHHGHHHNHTDWAQDWSRTAERTRGEIAASDRHRSHEVRDLLKCDADIRLDVQRTCTEMAQLKDELTCRMRNDGDKTRDLIRDIDNKRLERELADVKAELLLLKHRMPG